ncbi:hypothetical protein RA086_05260 [Lactiplantibacillus sp. WILCCON 0030]|uniref:DUF2187 domain-containing protein n=1 Tax=Lactiplantibacillus brownii TaxID=3069269 RepID=A0ABU1A7X8_9LACO|nr:hypothetical protein [Lactiplantibacillus brownii]MDQ7937034.1 hypothetical protein [Lactiplantibacillus brownii]
MLTKYQIGDLVNAKIGKATLVGVIVYKDTKHERYLVRVNGTQQLYYTETELTPYLKH